MGRWSASLIDLDASPYGAFLNYVNERTANHLNYAEPRLVDGTIARLWPHIMIQSGQMMLMYLFPGTYGKNDW